MSLPPDVRAAAETHLGHEVSGTPFDILSTHLAALPPGLARAVGNPIPPRDRARIPAIRRRRHLYASGTPRPASLSAEQGRLRWPLLWERLGGDPRVLEATDAQRDEAAWAENQFMPGRERFVGRLGRMLAEEEEIREWQEARDARARERALDMQGEEFDEESDEESDPAPAPAGPANGVVAPQSATPGAENQASVVDAFERELLELFLDGRDTIDYDDVDFAEPPRDPIAERDEEEAWFDDEEPSGSGARPGRPGASAGPGAGAAVMLANVSASVNADTSGRAGGAVAAPAAPAPNGTTVNGTSGRMSNGHVPNGSGRFSNENGQGEYDY